MKTYLYLFGLITAIALPGYLLALPLNDTGITRCGSADSSSNDLDCPVADAPGQDAQYGRDVTDNDDSDGAAGFSFTKLDANGNTLPASATDWSCVKDNVTGLIWEVKTDDGGLRDKDNTYTWYNTDDTTNGGNAGTANGGTCSGSACDTQSYVQAVNAQGLCGATDWRLPTDQELLSIVHDGVNRPKIDSAYFPRTRSAWFWSSSPDANSPDDAWLVSFYGGYVDNYAKSFTDAVRLVRAGQ